MQDQFYNFTLNINKLNKMFMIFIESELNNKGFHDINFTQFLLMKNIGEEKTKVCSATENGYYTGTNISYNIKALVKKGYIYKEDNTKDERSVLVSLTKKGLDLLDAINCAIESHMKELTSRKFDDISLEKINKQLYKMYKMLHIR